MKKLIVGVLGRFNYSPIKIKIDSGIYKENIASKALQRYYENKGEKATILLFAPESLITFIAENKEDAYEKISGNKLEDLVKEEVKEKLGINPQIVVTPSFGKYHNKNYSINFDASPQLIRAIMLLTLIKESRKYDEFILDISIGHNLYVSILQDVFRDLIVNKKLRTLLEDGNFKVKIAEIPPVLGPPGDAVFPLYFRKYDVKVFFEFPSKENPPDLGRYVDYSILRDDDELKKKNHTIKGKLSTYRKVFKAIKLNTPLVLMDRLLNMDVDNSLLAESLDMFYKIINKIQERKEVNIVNNEITISYVSVNADKMKETLHTAALSDALYHAYTRFIKGRENTTESILNTFKEIYEKVGLETNYIFLERDIKSIYAAKEKITEEWKELGEILRDERIQYEKREKEFFGGNIKRNFFAHSGFLKEFVLVRKEREKIYLKYKEKYKNLDVYNTIENWLG